MSNEKTHPWQENFTDFEAVLRADNALEFWNMQAIVRAFQIYQWSGVLTDDVLCLKHEPTGTLVRYDDKYLAIDPGSSDLKEAFPDLFLVLYALGWRNLTVFHPLGTIQDFLEDMGHGIPANMDMEVKAFNRETISDLPQFAHFQATATSESIPADVLAEQAARLQALLNESSEAEVATSPAGGLGSTVEDMIGSEPILFSVDAPGSEIDEAAVSVASVSTITPSKIEPKVAEVPMDERRDAAETGHAPEAVSHPSSAPHIPETETFLHLGNCIFAFDTPASRVSSIDVLAHALRNGIAEGQIKHLWPGNNNNALHWDVLGEVPVDCPTLAETLVEDMFPEERAMHLLSALFIAARRKNPQADLRSVLFILAKEERIAETLKHISDETEVLSASLLYNLSKVKAINALGTLAVIPAGSAFVDINDITGSSTPFTVRGLAMGEAAEMIVIHTDELDSHHTHWIAGVLNKLVNRHLQSKRFIKESSGANKPLVIIDNSMLVNLQKQYQQLEETLKQAGLHRALAA